MKAVHALTHPSAKLDRPTKSTANGASDATPEPHPPLVAYREHEDTSGSGVPGATALLEALDAEADEEHEDEPLER